MTSYHQCFIGFGLNKRNMSCTHNFYNTRSKFIRTTPLFLKKWPLSPTPYQGKMQHQLGIVEPAKLSMTLRVTNLQPKLKHFSQLASPFSDCKQDLLLLTEILKTILFWPALLEYIKIKCSESYSLAKERLLIFHFAKAQTFQGHLALFQWIPHHMSTSVQANK